MSIKTVHLKKEPDCFKVDRSSILGNPFELVNEKERERVCLAHKEYLRLILKEGYRPKDAAHTIYILTRLPISKVWKESSRIEFIKELNKLKEVYRANPNLKLGCWCSPKQCHADNYVEILEMEDMPAEVLADNFMGLI